jgi:hypothetical protein
VHHVVSGQDEHVEDVEQERGCRPHLSLTKILEQVEGGFAGLVDRDDLAVDDGIVRQCGQGRYIGGIAGDKVLAVAGAQTDLAGRLEGDGAVPVELEFFCGVARYVALRTEGQ